MQLKQIMVNTLSESRALVPFGDRVAETARPALRNRPSAAFIAQLVAIRAGAADYRDKRREEPRIATAAYQAVYCLGRPKSGFIV